MGPWLGLAARSVLNMQGWTRLDLKIWRTVLSAFAGATKASSGDRSIGCHAWLVHYKWRTTLRSRTAEMTIRAELACAAWDHRGPTILEPLA